MRKLLFVSLVTALSVSAYAKDNHKDELDPFADDIEERIEEMDEINAEEKDLLETLTSGQLNSGYFNEFQDNAKSGCRQFTCAVYLDIQKSIQRATLYVDGKMHSEFKVSTGKNEVDKKGALIKRYETPNFETHPNGRIYDKYSSSKYPGGDYAGLGNMPYAVFISGGFAVHGTPKGNWSKLGQKASHGCIRMHPDNAKIFNRMVRAQGIGNTWFSVRN